jgi:hypothetical protein
MPVEWSENGEVGLWLGFAERSGAGDRGAYDSDLDVTVMLLELNGHRGIWERFRVADAIDASMPAGTGTAATTCFEEGNVRHAAQLGFGPDGLTIARLWRIDSEALDLVEIGPDAASCPDLSAAPVGEGATGHIVTGVGGSASDPEACGRLLDLSESAPRPMPLVELGGTSPGQWGDIYRYAVSIVAGAAQPTVEPAPQSVWLQQFLGWDLGGHALWRVVDEAEVTAAGRVEASCWDSAGTPAVGLAGPDDPAGSVSKAWLVDLAGGRFVPTDAAGVSCEVILD